MVLTMRASVAALHSWSGNLIIRHPLRPSHQDAPVAVKERPSLDEVEIYLSVGAHDNVVGLRGLSQKERGCMLWSAALDVLQGGPEPRAARTPGPESNSRG
jgi:hypothetical protein